MKHISANLMHSIGVQSRLSAVSILSVFYFCILNLDTISQISQTNSIVSSSAHELTNDNGTVNLSGTVGQQYIEKSQNPTISNSEGFWNTAEVSARILYVNLNASGNNDGTSWENAFQDLQDALAKASEGDEIWVAAGMHSPGNELTDSFQLKIGVALFGGFDGVELMREQRDWRQNVTILSGDVNDNDIITFNDPLISITNNGENNYQVVTGSDTNETTILDGFTITGGNAVRNSGHDSGGGMFIANGNPTIRNCIFTGNQAWNQGAGIANNSSSPLLTNCIFYLNKVANFFGGGIANQNSHPRIVNCFFERNYSFSDGSGMANIGTSLAHVVNCVFTNNFSNDDGGGIANKDDATVEIINCTFSNNRANDAGGGLHIVDNTQALVKNSIFWGNTDSNNDQRSQINIDENGSVTITHSTIENLIEGGALDRGENVLNTELDPKFVEVSNPRGQDDTYFTADDGLQLTLGSPAKDTGISEANTEPTDILGQPRIQFGIIDQGAYEHLGVCLTKIAIPPRIRILSPLDFSEFTAPKDKIPVEIELIKEENFATTLKLFREKCPPEGSPMPCEIIEIAGLTQRPSQPEIWITNWENITLPDGTLETGQDYDLFAEVIDPCNVSTVSESIRVTIKPFTVEFIRPAINEQAVRKGDLYRFSWTLPSDVDPYTFSLYLFEQPSLLLEQIQNGEAILVNNALNSSSNALGFSDNLLNGVRSGLTETTWYPHLEITSGQFVNQIYSGSNTLTVKDETVTNPEDVMITIIAPPLGTEILFGQGINIEAIIEGVLGTTLSGSNTVTIRFTKQSENPIVDEIIDSVDSGKIDLNQDYVPTSTGTYEVKVDWPGNAAFNSGESDPRSFIVNKSKPALELFDLGAPHFFGRNLRITGRLSILNGNPGEVSLSGINIIFEITNPSGDLVHSSTIEEVVTDKNGIFDVEFESDSGFFNEIGDWSVQALSEGNNNIEETSSPIFQIPVRSKRGYVILCQGSVEPDGLGIREGADEHRNTLDFVEEVFNKNGQIPNSKENTEVDDFIEDDDIFEIYEDDAHPKEELRHAIVEWASRKLLANPAPLYVVLTNHGDPGKFHLYSENSTEDKILTPRQLNRMFIDLESALPDDHLAQEEKIIVVLGMCFSGSFIPELSRENRIIVTASAANERSIRGPGDIAKRQGEYFVYLLFRELGNGLSLLNSFTRANQIIRQTSSDFELANNSPTSQFPGEKGQHPLLDDDGDGVGSLNVSRTVGDGQNAAKVVVKVPDNTLGEIKISRTSPTIFLGQNTVFPDPVNHLILFAEVDENFKDQNVFPISMKVKKPRTPEDSNPGGTTSMQADLKLIFQAMKPDPNTTGRVRYLWPNNENSDATLFMKPGQYEVFFFTRKSVDASSPISPPGITRVIRASESNKPSPFDLMGPDPGNTITYNPDDPEDSLGFFSWHASTPVTGNIHYLFRLWEDEKGNKLRLESDPLSFPNFLLTPDLVESTTYWWDVVAFDDANSFRFSNPPLRQITILETNDPIGFIDGQLFDLDAQGTSRNVSIKSMTFTPKEKKITINGNTYSAVVPSGSIKVEVEAEGYEEVQQFIEIAPLSSNTVNFSAKREDFNILIQTLPQVNINVVKDSASTTDKRQGYQIQANSGSSAEFSDQLPADTLITITVPRSIVDNLGINHVFTHWQINEINQTPGEFRVRLVLEQDTAATAVYEPGAISLQVRSTPFDQVTISGSHGGITNYITILHSATDADISLTAPDEFEGSPFVKWVINDQDEVTTQPLSQTLSEDSEVVAVYETQWNFEPGWNLISTPVDLDNSVITLLQERLRPPIWKWTGKKFEVTNQVEPGFGYWVNTSSSRIMKPEGNFSGGEVEIQKGWNLIGIKRHQSLDKSALLDAEGTVWGWDCKNQQFFDINDESRLSFQQGLLFPGQGYWVYKK